jgi:hypothetical protein
MIDFEDALNYESAARQNAPAGHERHFKNGQTPG